MADLIKIFDLETSKRFDSWEEKFICENDDDEGALFLSKEIFTCDDDPDYKPFKYRYAIDCFYDWEGEKWIYSLMFVLLPESITEKNLAAVASTCGVELDEVGISDMLAEGGLAVHLDSTSTDGEELDDNTITNIAHVFETIDRLRGFYFDKTWNAIGSNGWDVLDHALNDKDLLLPAIERAKNHG